VLPPVRIEHPHVITRANVMNGSPHVEGSRVPVRRLWAWFKRGVPIATLLERYSTLGPQRVLSALAFAFDNQELVEADLMRWCSELNVESECGVGQLRLKL
jgi:uncharacterized protein (DUF433 family)